MQNTSQDPDFVGPTGYEKRVIHQTHFGVVRTLKKSKTSKSKNKWVKIGVGKYKLVKDDRLNY